MTRGANRSGAYVECRRVLWWKTIPLSVISTVLCAIDIPDSFRIVKHALAQLSSSSAAEYSAIDTTFVVVMVLLAFLAGHTIVATVILGQKVYRLNPARGDYAA